MDKTAQLIKNYIAVCHSDYKQEYHVPLFYNQHKKKLIRAGIAYILSKYTAIARRKNPAIIPDTVSPHGIRHCKSMHMLETGVPLIYIRDYLGHSEISTTEIYARISSALCPNSTRACF